MKNLARSSVEQFADLLHYRSPKNLYQFTLDHGKECQVQPLTFTEARYICQLVRLMGGQNEIRPQECFYNSQRMMVVDAARDKLLRYIEGYIVVGDTAVPIQHAWCQFNGKVIDLTTRRNIKQTKDRIEYHYFGMEFDHGIIFKNMMLHRYYNPVAEDTRLLYRYFEVPTEPKRGRPKTRKENV
jgi:hypothetical protein